ncbi:unnamed protein product, partial [Mesorhabditis belari]|uniref:C-type lectin domain-containing protein n=1 Tax=Mesorhabditis belari TaxID=2138241 RepID=A0AAF3EQC8_9BILA
MPEMTQELPEKTVKRIEEPAISLKKIAQLEADSEEIKKDKDVEMRQLAASMVQIEANLKITELEADLVDERERNRELERKIAETKRKNDDLETQLNRTMNLLDLYRDGWSYLAKTASWYKGFGQWMTFDEAEAYCASRKGHLVSIHSQEENDFVWKLAKNFPANRSFWIGLKRNLDKGNAFEWTDGSSVDFTNWMVGEPDSYTHAVLWNDKGKWGVDPPNEEFQFICKRDAEF